VWLQSFVLVAAMGYAGAVSSMQSMSSECGVPGMGVRSLLTGVLWIYPWHYGRLLSRVVQVWYWLSCSLHGGFLWMYHGYTGTDS